MIILSIETSCDDTSIAITKDGKKVLSNIIFSQNLYHQEFGGVMPEIAARKHVEYITIILQKVFVETQIKPQDIDLVAVTEGPGLISSLFVGINLANLFAYIYQKPLLGVNHLIGHIYSIQIEHELKFPSLVLLISGGHTELFYIKDHFQIKHLGTTLDDAIGEVYDKIAKNLNLGYPGGPIIEKLASQGQDNYHFVRPYLKNKNLNFSFSGLKSNIIYFINQLKNKNQQIQLKELNDICASFQASIFDVLIIKLQRALAILSIKQLIVVGGVASNRTLKKILQQKFDYLEVIFPSSQYCTDQAAMIGIAAYYQNEFDQKAQKKYNMTGNADLSFKFHLKN
ncbi:tRNA (adenosine(37)-N6)-threonylcarbamoyltransferase complex transferase subunit TsaD [Candidatus Phytoplasma pini]|uniref:tRNA N6-adenosine threonylcarbamoyltransferase n=1 Tax=Candidatus Phytoplasma pini TaxID=267362 RepID=A0A559KJY0_9MOLU|nr:tRNA (adenosine(37)-N6)-threonylcarbamoyltransferase complex transferase subunit TsaD [Candidatus Phytoplasma pini]TVY12436.1 O-sialoglycoprotein endopeptidase-like protein [Candidatus Phytoplasma pini]